MYFYVAVPSTPAHLILTYSWACVCQMGFSPFLFGVSCRKDTGRKNGGDMVPFLKDQLQSSFKAVKDLILCFHVNKLFCSFMDASRRLKTPRSEMKDSLLLSVARVLNFVSASDSQGHCREGQVRSAHIVGHIIREKNSELRKLESFIMASKHACPLFQMETLSLFSKAAGKHVLCSRERQWNRWCSSIRLGVLLAEGVDGYDVTRCSVSSRGQSVADPRCCAARLPRFYRQW